MNHVEVRDDECKGCAVCISICPKGCLALSGELNVMGYEYVEFVNSERCTACGLCFLACPEPGALAVFRAQEAL